MTDDVPVSFGPLVQVIITPFDGDPFEEWMHAGLAVIALRLDKRLGVEWYSAHIVADWEDCDFGIVG